MVGNRGGRRALEPLGDGGGQDVEEELLGAGAFVVEFGHARL